MKKKELVLRTFLIENLASHGFSINEQVLDAVVEVVVLEEGTPDEKEETRSIRLEENASGKVTAKSIKLYNLIKMSNYDLVKLLLGEYAMILSYENKAVFTLAVLALIHEFYPKHTVDFNEKDSKILLTIYELGQPEFLITDLITAFQTRFNQPLTEDQAKQSLAYFQELKVVKYLGTGKYKTQESMVYERN